MLSPDRIRRCSGVPVLAGRDPAYHNGSRSRTESKSIRPLGARAGGGGPAPPGSALRATAPGRGPEDVPRGLFRGPIEKLGQVTCKPIRGRDSSCSDPLAAKDACGGSLNSMSLAFPLVTQVSSCISHTLGTMTHPGSDAWLSPGRPGLGECAPIIRWIAEGGFTVPMALKRSLHTVLARTRLLILTQAPPSVSANSIKSL